ncbi:MAG: beta-ribofuranosylaminobenzene 5'-phosphate synthase [Candidatus Heimdallarchaeota archaeon]
MQVRVKTPSRLHWTLIDLHGGVGRIDGGIGVALEDPHISLKVQPSEEQFTVRGAALDLIYSLVDRFFKNVIDAKGHYNKYTRKHERINLEIDVLKMIPRHVGMGSMTQLSLALGMTLNRLLNLNYTVREIAKVMWRGGTSGIGIAAFEHGGFILDAGHSFGLGKQKSNFLPSRAARAPPAPILIRHEVPRDWVFVITLPQIEKGAHGTREVDIFQKYCPIPEKEVEKLSRIILMQLLPGIVELDIYTVGTALTAIQQLGFKKIEIELQHKIIGKLMEMALATGATGSGMSSFGPTTYALVSGQRKVDDVKKAMQATLEEENITGEVLTSRVNNDGATIEVKE